MNVGLLVGRLFLALIGVLFIVFGLIVKQPCDLDAVYLSCRLTGTIWDWVGTIGFLGSLLVMGGAFKFINKSLSAPNSLDTKLVALMVLAVGSIVLLWNA